MEEARLPHNHKHLPALLPRFLFLHPTRHLPLHLPSLHHPYHRHSNLRRRLPLPPLKIHSPFGRPRRAILPLHGLPPQRHRPHLVLRLLPNRHRSPRRHPTRLLVLLPKQHPPHHRLPSHLRPGYLHQPDPPRLHRRNHLRRHLQRARSHGLWAERVPRRQHRGAGELEPGERGRDEREWV